MNTISAEIWFDCIEITVTQQKEKVFRPEGKAKDVCKNDLVFCGTSASDKWFYIGRSLYMCIQHIDKDLKFPD